MSRPSDLPNDRESVYKYVLSLTNIPQVTEVRLVGSRSPRHWKEPREYSDWDLAAISEDRIHIPSPRSLGYLHVDLVTLKPEVEYPHQVQVWPQDEFGVFDGLA